MNASDVNPVAPLPGMTPPAKVVAWASRSIFEPPPDDQKYTRLARRMGASLTPTLVTGLILLLGGLGAATAIQEQKDEKLDVVYLQTPGPGGGGGGSPAPAPPKKLEVPKAAPAPTPVVPTPVPVTPPPPDLNAVVQTNTTDLLQATGANAVSLAAYAGGGRGNGIGSGTGNGVGPGTGGGFGGGAYRPGSGIENPVPLKQVQPKYTSEAMRAKLQGIVELEAVVTKNGTVSDVRVTHSLDSQFGLDQEAIKAAKQWLFRPGTKQGVAVDVIVGFSLEFRLH